MKEQNKEGGSYSISSFFLFFCTSALANSKCKQFILSWHPEVRTAAIGHRDILALDVIGKDLYQKYKKTPDLFLRGFQAGINSEDINERINVLIVIRYMRKPPLKVLQLTAEKLDDPAAGVREDAYRTLMAFDIRDEGVLQKIRAKARQRESSGDQIWARRVLEIQTAKRRK